MSTLNVISGQFGLLVHNLIKGNMNWAKELSKQALENSERYGMNICMQDIIEELANEQAFKSGIVNSPSIFPGMGTLISFFLLGTENFLILEQGVKLSIVLLLMNGFKDGDDNLEESVIRILGEAYEIADNLDKTDISTITEQYVTRVLPPKYLSKGLNKLVSKIFPTRNRFLKLLPVFGIFYSAIEGYSMTVKVGQVALKRIKKEGS
jgi:hypothetical protein